MERNGRRWNIRLPLHFKCESESGDGGGDKSKSFAAPSIIMVAQRDREREWNGAVSSPSSFLCFSLSRLEGKQARSWWKMNEELVGWKEKVMEEDPNNVAYMNFALPLKNLDS